MKLFEKNLNKIIKVIEKYGVVGDVEIMNSSILISVPAAEDGLAHVMEVDLNKPNRFKISFTLGDKKSTLPGEEE